MKDLGLLEESYTSAGASTTGSQVRSDGPT